MRKVFDVMWFDGVPVAYDLNAKERYHQAVCPWCGGDLERFTLPRSTVIELYERLYDITADHMPECPRKDVDVNEGLAVYAEPKEVI